MTTKFTAIIPFIEDMGTIQPMAVSESTMESKEENCLWHLNSMRQHDGLAELDMNDFEELGVTFSPVDG